MSEGEQKNNKSQKPFVEVSITNVIIKKRILYWDLMKETPA